MSVLYWKSKTNLEQLHRCVCEVMLPLHPLRLTHAVVEVLVLNLVGTEVELLHRKHPKMFA